MWAYETCLKKKYLIFKHAHKIIDGMVMYSCLLPPGKNTTKNLSLFFFFPQHGIDFKH